MRVKGFKEVNSKINLGYWRFKTWGSRDLGLRGLG